MPFQRWNVCLRLTDEYYGFSYAYSEEQAVNDVARWLGSDPANFYAYATMKVEHEDSFSSKEALKPTQW